MRVAAALAGWLTVVSWGAPATNATALPGDLDATFGNGGAVETDLGLSSWGAVAGLVDPLGRVKVSMAGRTGHYVVGALPPTLTVVLAPPATADGRCLEVAFGAAECLRATNGDVRCRHRAP